MKNRAFAVLAVLLLGFFGAGAANAQQPDYDPQVDVDQQGPPPDAQQEPNPYPPQAQGAPVQGTQTDADQGAGRVSFIRGEVSMQRGDTGESSSATINTPLMAGDKISTGAASRAEVQLDFANVLRLDENAQVNIVTLNRSHIQLQLAAGLASYSAVRQSEADVEIDTPNVSVHPQRQGRYRIQVNANGDTEVLVRDGEADVATPQGSTQVHKGELITIQGNSDQAQFRVNAAPGNNEWDTFNDNRDSIIANAQTFQHTSPYYAGGQDLDPYGEWSEVPNYGQVWTPNVDAGWAPYRAGRWVYEPYWGWTWVSYEQWGWAPYHYGRWFLNGARWAWWPGPAYVGYRPLWAPAYVSFFGLGGGVGFGVGFGLGFGFGNVGWLAIGPGDFFHPWWGGYRGGFALADVHNYYNVRGGFAPLHGGGFSNFRDLERNDRLRAGMSSVSSRGFGTGGESARGVSAQELRNARGITGGMPISPSRGGMRVSDRPANSGAFSAHANERFFSNGAAGGARGFQGPGGGFNRSPAAPQAGGWQRFSPRGEAGDRGGNVRGSVGSQPSYRPPLSMNRPIVNENQRSFGGPGGNNRNDGSGRNEGNNGGYRGGFPATPNERGQAEGNRDEGNRSFGRPNSGDRGGNPGGANPPESRGQFGGNPSFNGGTRGGEPAPSYRGSPAPSGRGEASPGYRGAPSPSYRSAPAPSRGPSGGSFGGGSSRGGEGGGTRGGGGGGNRGGSNGGGNRGGGGGHHR